MTTTSAHTTNQRIYNFSPGPAMLPEEVLRQAQQEMMSLPGLGMSVLEISHRCAAYEQIQQAAEANLRKLLGVGDNFHVLFLQGGARLQFSMVPMNLLHGDTADYIVTGSWGEKAVVEARREGTVKVAWDGRDTGYDRLPANDPLQLDPSAVYVHFTSNETIGGVQFVSEPETGSVPLVCDASSDFLCRPLDMARYGLIYACAQKNAGPAGVTIVLIRDDLVERTPANLPGMLSYRNHVDEHSLYNTPPVFGVYIVRLVTDWLLGTIGGLENMLEQNRRKAAMLYTAVDRSDGFYNGHAQAGSRSLMNVTFRLPDDDLQGKFIAAAAERGLQNLKGHRSVGGIRASIYNAMPTAGVQALAEFMDDFRESHR